MPEERLGRYILDRKIASGGMAEVFLARQSGPEGYERTCVIKRMLKGISDDEVFVRMFLDEARLASQLSHPNIAQIYDFGEDGGVFFLAMEYVPGATLREVIGHHRARNSFLPLSSAARIISDAGRGLAYAHEALGQDGEPLNIVHRDVSPHNILLSRGGTVKVIDFGIAKAASATGQTSAGVIKGKYAYMSPEQVLGQPLDKRTDIYALGLVLYELLTNQRAIQGNEAQAMMTAAARPAFQPISQLRPETPEPLLRIAERALAQQRDTRYASAERMSQELDEYLRTQAAVTDTGLATLLPPATAESSRRISSPSNRTRQETPRALSASGRATFVPEGKEATTTPGPPLVVAVDPTFVRDTTPSRPQKAAAQPSRRGPLLLGAASFLAVCALALVMYWLRAPPTASTELLPLPAPVAPAVAPAQPPPAAAPVPSEPAAQAPPEPKAPVADGPEPKVADAKNEPKHPARVRDHHRPRLAAAEHHDEPTPAAPKGTVDIRALPYAEVFLNEKSVGVTPFKPLELPAGHYRFRLVNQTRSETRDVDVEPGKSSVVRVDLRAQQ